MTSATSAALPPLEIEEQVSISLKYYGDKGPRKTGFASHFQHDGETVLELLDRVRKTHKDPLRLEDQGKRWELAIKVVKVHKGRYPFVLVMDRRYDALTEQIKEDGCGFHWTDSSGLRSVFWWGPESSKDYTEAIDLPESAFAALQSLLKQRGITPSICLRILDPGLGIYIPELDDPSFIAKKD